MPVTTRRQKKLSPYGQQLQEKQRAKETYGLREKQFHLLFERAKRIGNAPLTMLQLLESRLDNVVYRAGLTKSRAQARQLVNHCHILVNDKVVNIPSYQLKTGDLINIKKSKKQKKIWQVLLEEQKKQDLPGWLTFDPNDLQIKVLHIPGSEEVDQSINSQAIVEFYSR